MIQVIPQPRDEKIAMYMKLTKGELAAMLVGANEAIDALSRNHPWQITIPAVTSTPPVETTVLPPNTCWRDGRAYQ